MTAHTPGPWKTGHNPFSDGLSMRIRNLEQSQSDMHQAADELESLRSLTASMEREIDNLRDIMRGVASQLKAAATKGRT